jgi:hypothetical protein
MALTVLLPSMTGNESSEVNISCVGCAVTLQQRRFEENGCANQKWSYDKSLGFLFPFNATEADKGKTFHKNQIRKTIGQYYRNDGGQSSKYLLVYS